MMPIAELAKKKQYYKSKKVNGISTQTTEGNI